MSDGSSTEIEVEEINASSRKDEYFSTFAARQKRRKFFDIWKPSRTSSGPMTNTGSKKTVAPNLKRIIGQYFLDLGQKDFSYSTCPVCGLLYARGLEADEIVHSVFHKSRTKGISFKGWQDERVVSKIDDKGNRVILVLSEDNHHRHKVKEIIAVVEAELGLSPGWLIQKACKVYLFISSSRKVVGCLMAEPIQSAFQVVPSKKQEGKRVCEEVPVGEERRTSVLCAERSSGCKPTTSPKDHPESESSVTEPRIPSEQRVDDVTGDPSKKLTDAPDFSNVCLQAGNLSTTEPKSRTCESSCMSDSQIACGAVKLGAEVSYPVRAITGVSTKSGTRKITDFFELRSIPSWVGKDNKPSDSRCSVSMNSLHSFHIKKGKERDLMASTYTGTRLSKISDYFVRPRSKSSLLEGIQSLQAISKKAGASVTTGSVEAQGGKETTVSGEKTIKLERVGDVSLQIEVEEGKRNIAKPDSERKDVAGDKMIWEKLDIAEGSGLEGRFSSTKHGDLGASCVPHKVEIKHEAKFESSDVQGSRKVSSTADFTGGKSGVQVSLKDEVVPNAELDDVQEEHPEEKGDESSVNTSVHKESFKQVTTGANFILFGNVKLCREVIPRKRPRQEHSEDLGSAIMYNTTPIPAVCGVRVIWVSSSDRRKGIASHLLDAMRRTFCLGVILKPSQFAFSQPTTDGRKFAARYCGADEFLVYTNS